MNEPQLGSLNKAASRQEPHYVTIIEPSAPKLLTITEIHALQIFSIFHFAILKYFQLEG